MSYFETTRIKDTSGQAINPASEESITLLRRIFQLLKPLGQITGGGSNRLSVDVNNVVGGTIGSVGTVTTVTGVTTVNTVTTVGTVNGVTAVTSVNQLGGITTFELLKAMSRTGYNTGNRSNISF